MNTAHISFAAYRAHPRVLANALLYIVTFATIMLLSIMAHASTAANEQSAYLHQLESRLTLRKTQAQHAQTAIEHTIKPLKRGKIPANTSAASIQQQIKVLSQKQQALKAIILELDHYLAKMPLWQTAAKARQQLSDMEKQLETAELLISETSDIEKADWAPNPAIWTLIEVY